MELIVGSSECIDENCFTVWNAATDQMEDNIVTVGAISLAAKVTEPYSKHMWPNIRVQ
jgi:hypothetical protein